MNRVLYFFLHFALILLFSYAAFTHVQGRLFIGNDGPMLLALAKEQIDFFGFTLNLHTNFLQGLGNFSFPMNLAAIPGYWLPIYDSAGNFTPAATYTWFAALMFITVLLVGWNYHFPRGVTYVAAWLLTVLMFPYIANYFRIYAVTSSSPIFIFYMFAVAVADIGVRRLGQHYLYALPLLAGILMMLVVSPAAMILIAPFLIVSFMVTFYLADNSTRKRMVIAGVGVITVCTALGWVEYVAGLLLYSSGGFYFDELANNYSNAREFASILFQGHVKDRAFGPWLFGFAAIGAFWALYSKDHKFKNPAIILFAGQMLHAGIAAQLLAWSRGWAGPPPIYTEMTFFALYTLFAVYFFANLIPARVHTRVAMVCCIALMFVVFALPAEKERNLMYSFAMPSATSPIIDLLHKEIALVPGGTLKGRVVAVLPATFLGQTLFSYQYNMALKNDHLSDGLWLHDIPTLGEYNQLITPAFYRITKRFLTLPNDRQNRSWASFSYIDQKMLRMLGVRYLLSINAEIDGAKKRAEIAAPNVQSLKLFELADANVAGVAATQIIPVKTLAEAENAMGAKAFDTKTAVVFSTVEGELLPVTQSSITIEKGGWRIRATSAGKSLLMVPVEYSHCSEVSVLSGNAPQLRRVNIALTGLVFNKEMDILLTSSIGPFHQPRCRMQDYKEFRGLL